MLREGEKGKETKRERKIRHGKDEIRDEKR